MRIFFLAAVAALVMVPHLLAVDLFWNDNAGIHRVRPGDPTEPLLFETFETRGLAADTAGDRLYWTDMLTGKIQRTVMSGILPFFEDVVTGLDSPTAIATILARLFADFDNDSDVDRDDFLVWQNGFGITGGAFHKDGDADSDSDVDGNDFLIWQQEYGSGSGLLGSAAVPEPASIILLLTLATFALTCCWMRRR